MKKMIFLDPSEFWDTLAWARPWVNWYKIRKFVIHWNTPDDITWIEVE